jgi:hypothetical protein
MTFHLHIHSVQFYQRHSGRAAAHRESMADPISVAASVVGLLTAAAQISQTLYSVTRRVKKAPKECKPVRAEVDDIRNILS